MADGGALDLPPGKLFDQDPEGMAPPGAPRVCVIPAACGVTPDPAQAIIEASVQVELFDEGLWAVPKQWFDPFVIDDPTLSGDPSTVGASIQCNAQGTFPVALASDHAGLPAVVDATGAAHVLYLGARPHLDGASPIGRLAEQMPVTAWGLRACSAADAAIIDRGENNWRGHWWPPARGQRAPSTASDVLKGVQADGPLLLWLDLDVFDPAAMPAVRSPQPGGPDWTLVTRLLDSVIAAQQVCAIGISGLVPNPALHAADFFAAKLLYRLLAAQFRPSP